VALNCYDKTAQLLYIFHPSEQNFLASIFFNKSLGNKKDVVWRRTCNSAETRTSSRADFSWNSARAGDSDVSEIRQRAIDEATRAYEQWLATLAGRVLTLDPVTILHDFVSSDQGLILACTIQVVYRERIRDFL
jgi:hypothetical protein